MTTNRAPLRLELAAKTFGPRGFGLRSCRLWVVAAAVAAVSGLGACTDPAGEPAEQPAAAASSAADQSATVTPSPTPLPEATRPVAGTRAALRCCRDRTSAPLSATCPRTGICRCSGNCAGSPSVTPFGAAIRASSHGLLEKGGSAGSGPTPFTLGCSPMACGKLSRRARGSTWATRNAQAGPSPIKHRGWCWMTEVGCVPRAGPRPRCLREKARHGCPVRRRVGGSCQLDPDPGRIWRLPGKLSWAGTWDQQTSILGRATSHISGTWSVDGGSTWNQSLDTWTRHRCAWAGPRSRHRMAYGPPSASSWWPDPGGLHRVGARGPHTRGAAAKKPGRLPQVANDPGRHPGRHRPIWWGLRQRGHQLVPGDPPRYGTLPRRRDGRSPIGVRAVACGAGTSRGPRDEGVRRPGPHLVERRAEPGGSSGGGQPMRETLGMVVDGVSVIRRLAS